MLRMTILSFLAVLAPLVPAVRAVEVGEPAPDFTLQDLAGTEHTLSAHRGKVVLLGLVGYD